MKYLHFLRSVLRNVALKFFLQIKIFVKHENKLIYF